MGRKNHRRGKPQARRDRVSTGAPPPPPLSTMVVPKGKCFHRSRHGKLIFTAETADKALKQAQAARERRGSGHVEQRAYACPEGGCGGWHLTSRKHYEERGKAS